MAHNTDYSKIWDPSGSTEGLSLYEIAKSLGVSTQDLGRLCQSDNIHKWAKYKPVRLETYQVLPEWWKGYNKLFGFASSMVFNRLGDGSSLPTDFIKQLASGNIKWNYERPTGGIYPFRLLDFDKYFRDAESPAPSVYTTEIGILVSNLSDEIYEVEIYIPSRRNGDLDEWNLSVEDFTGEYSSEGMDLDIPNMYTGVLLYTINLGGFYVATDTQTVQQRLNVSSSTGNVPGMAKIPLTKEVGRLLAGTASKVFAIPFFSTTIVSDFWKGKQIEIPDGLFIPSFDATPSQIEIYDRSYNRFFHAYWTGSDGPYWDRSTLLVKYEFELVNDSNTDIVTSLRVDVFQNNIPFNSRVIQNIRVPSHSNWENDIDQTGIFCSEEDGFDPSADTTIKVSCLTEYNRFPSITDNVEL